MSDYRYVEKFLKTGKLIPNACYYFDPPLKEMEMWNLQILFKNIKGNEIITYPLRHDYGIQELLWLDTDGGGSIVGWQNPEEYVEYEDGTEENPLMTYDDIINWFLSHNEYGYYSPTTFVDGRMFIQEGNATDLFDQIQEGRINEIGGKRAKDTHIIYRDNEMVILVPLSFESAKSFSRNTQYCTGGDCSKSSESSSKDMYDEHTKKGDILYRIFFKDGTKVRLTWNGDIEDKNFHWGLGKKDSYPTFTSRNMTNPFDLEQVKEIRLEQLEIDFETEPREKEFDEWEKKFCNQWGWDVHSLWEVYQKIRKKWGFPDWRSGESKPMDPQNYKKMQEEEEEVYRIYETKKKEIFGKYYGKTAWWNDGHEMLYKAILRIPNDAITKMVEYVMGGQYKPKPIQTIQEDIHIQDNIRDIKVGDKIWITLVNPELRNCDKTSYNKLSRIVNEVCTVVGVSDNVDLCQEDGRAYGDYAILIQNPKIQGHDGQGKCPNETCYWVNPFYATFSKVEPFDSHGAFEQLFEQDGDDEFSWVRDIGLPQDLSISHLGKHNITKLRLEDIQQGAMIRRHKGKFIYEIGEKSEFNIGGVMQPGYILKNLSTGKNYFTKISQMLREFYLISA